MLKATDPAHYQPAAGVVYPKTEFGNSLKQVAQLMKANLGVEAAFSDIGGWDTHQNQGNVDGQLANRLKDFSEGIAAFWQDHGAGGGERDSGDDVGVWPDGSAEWDGRNRPRPCECNVRAGRAGQGRQGIRKWPGLDNDQLNEGRDLAVTTDFRRVLGEAAYKTLGAKNLKLVFPGSQVEPGEFLGFI